MWTCGASRAFHMSLLQGATSAHPGVPPYCMKAALILPSLPLPWTAQTPAILVEAVAACHAQQPPCSPLQSCRCRMTTHSLT
jgi:hypothetical protein